MGIRGWKELARGSKWFLPHYDTKVSPAKSLLTVLGTLTVCLFLNLPAQSEQLREASAVIRASATVVNPTGLTLFDHAVAQTASSEFGFGTNNLLQKPAEAVFVHFPPGSSVLLMIEAEGKLVDRFSMSSGVLSSHHVTEYSQPLSGGYLLEQQVLTESLPEGSSNCIVTIIHTGS